MLKLTTLQVNLRNEPPAAAQQQRFTKSGNLTLNSPQALDSPNQRIEPSVCRLWEKISPDSCRFFAILKPAE